jgi:hypothetical protein
MVQRSELMAAISEANAKRDEAASKEQDLQWYREQLSKTREQLHEAREEAGQMHISMGNMVQRSVLAELKAAADLHQETLQESLKKLQNDKAGLEQLLQVLLQ